jgi:hypothetical protein
MEENKSTILRKSSAKISKKSGNQEKTGAGRKKFRKSKKCVDRHTGLM